MEVHPLTVTPVYFKQINTMSTIRLIRNIRAPNHVIILIGLMLKDVIPSNANANIFLRGYFDSPAKRSFLSYSTVVDLNPISGTIPRKNKFTSSNCDKASKAEWPMR